MVYCKEIPELPGVEHSMSLKELNARNCPKLQWDGGYLADTSMIEGKPPHGMVVLCTAENV